MNRALYVFPALAMLTACNPPMPVAERAKTPAQRATAAALMEDASQNITCTTGADCDSKWRKAQDWIAKNSTYTLETKTDGVLKTYGPLEPTTDSAFLVTKAPAGGNTHIIMFHSTCGETNRCVPTTLELKASFTDYLAQP